MKQLKHSLWQRITAVSLSFLMASAGLPSPAIAESTQANDASASVVESTTAQEPDTNNGESSEASTDEVVSNDKDLTALEDSSNETASQPDNESGITEGSNSDVTKPIYDAFWSAFRGGIKGNTTDVALPTTAGKAAWISNMLGTNTWTALSEPLVINNDIYLTLSTQDEHDVYVQELIKLDATTGALRQSAPLSYKLGYATRPVFTDGLILIPLNTGRVQAFAADTLKEAWTSDPVPQDADANIAVGTGVVKDGIAYFQTYRSDESNASIGGYIIAVNVSNGSTAWTYENTTSGYYWAGPAFVGNSLVIADEAGTLTSFNAKDGKVLSSISLGAKVRSGVVTTSDGTGVYVADRAGTLHKVSVSSTGDLTQDSTVKFGSDSTSTPTVVNGKIFIGGCASDPSGTTSLGADQNNGVLAVIDEQTFTVEKTITQTATATGTQSIPADVKASPLVSTAQGRMVAYFTSNSTPGSLYAYAFGSDTATAIYTPAEEFQNYSTSSPVPLPDGSILYVVGPATLIKVVADDSPTPTPTPTPTPSKDAKPELSFDDVASKIMGKDSVGTITLSQRASVDTTSLELWVDLPDVLEFSGSEASVLVDGEEFKTVEYDGQNVKITIEGADAIALREASSQANTDDTKQEETKEEEAKDSKQETKEEESETQAYGKLVQLVVKVKEKSNADLSAYDNNGVSVVPVTGSSRFNEDENRTYSETKSLKFKTSSSSGSSSGSTSSSSANKQSTAKTGDTLLSFTAIAMIAIAAVALIGGALFLRHRNTKDQ